MLKGDEKKPFGQIETDTFYSNRKQYQNYQETGNIQDFTSGQAVVRQQDKLLSN